MAGALGGMARSANRADAGGQKARDLAPLSPRPPRAADDADEMLAARAAAGDMGAFDALVTLYTGRVFGVAYRMLGDRAEAEDLAQEVFVALHKALPDFRGDSRLSTWVYRITRNRCLNRLKFLKRRHIGTLADIDDPAVAGHARCDDTSGGGVHDPRRRLAEAELSSLVETHLAALPEDQRTLVVLRDLEDLSYEEIVDITGLPLGTVKSRLHRARAALAKALHPHFPSLPSDVGAGVP